MLSTLTPDNIHKIKPLKYLGRGEIKAMAWLDEDTLAVASTFALWHYTRDGQEHEICRFGKHAMANEANFSEDRSTLFFKNTKVVDEQIKHLLYLHDVHTGQLLSTIDVGLGPKYIYALSPDRSILITVSKGKVQIFNVPTEQMIYSMDVRWDASAIVFIAKDECAIVFANAWNEVLYFNIPAQKIIRRSLLMDEDGLIPPKPSIFEVVQDALGQEYWTLRVHGNYIHAITGSDKDNGANIHLLRNGVVQVLQGHQYNVHTMFLMEGDKKLVSIDVDNLLIIWDTQTGEIFNHYEGLKRGIMQPHSDQPIFAMVSLINEIIIWNYASNEIVSFTQGHSNSATRLHFSHDGNALVSLSNYDYTGQFWQIDRSSPLLSKQMKFPLMVTADEKWFLYCNGELARWGDQVWLWEQKVLGGFGNPVHIFKINRETLEEEVFLSLIPQDFLYISPDCRWYLRRVEAEGFSLFEFETHRLLCMIFTPENTLRRAMFSPDGMYFFTFARHTLQIWEITTGKEITRIETVFGLLSCFSPDGKFLLVGGENELTLRNMKTHEEDKRLSLDGELKKISFSPDGTIFFTRTTNKIQLWDIQTGSEMARFNFASYLKVRFSPNSQFLIVGNDVEVFLWNTRTRDIQSRFEVTGKLSKLAFSSDSTMFVISYLEREENLEIWETVTMTRLATLTTRQPFAMIFSPDGKWLGLSHADSTISLWGVEEETRSE